MKDSTEDKFRKMLAKKKFQVEVEISGKRKFVYLNDLYLLDDMMKEINGKVVEVVELK